jgi:putative serine protease PepD
MFRKRTSIVIAAAALAAGVGLGAGSYAGLAAGDATTTVVETTSQDTEAAAATTSLSVGEIYTRTYEGVVEITTTSSGSSPAFPFGGEQTQEATGSGFVYDEDGHVVTNYHVVDGASAITVTLADGSEYEATVVGSDASTDLAVLKIDAPASVLHPLTLGDSSALAVGDGVVAIGSPFGLEETATSGIVSALNRTISSQNRYSISDAIQTDAAINSGNSGGPLLNLQGEVIGITSQIESESGGNDGVGFAIPSNTVRSVVDQLISGQEVEHAYLGVSIQTPSEGSGAEIADLTSGSPAADVGLETGDVITAFDGQKITSPDDLTSAVSAKKPGDKVEITYLRNGETQTTDVTLGSRPS